MAEFRVEFKDDTAEPVTAEDFEYYRTDNGTIVLRFDDDNGEFVFGTPLDNVKFWTIVNAE